MLRLFFSLSLFAGTATAGEVDYLKDVKPLLSARCYACHGAVRQKNGLRLDTVQFIKQGGQSGPALEPGHSNESLIIEAVTGQGASRMPPEGEATALTAEQIDLLRRWIDEGAKAPADEQPQQDPRRHWAFQPVERPAVPLPKNAWGVNSLDAFVAAEHERRGLIPNLPASKETLLRRVYVDLVGFPPTWDELREFLADASPSAYEAAVDRLLASPHYGERWGRHFMDVWRYSDPFGNANELRYSQRHIWRWRDWIVDSLNADKGYDRMIIEMLAGDEVAPNDPKTLRATGFVARNWYKFNRNDWLRETVDHTALGFLGLTLKCARCHDHKFDPLSQADYYRFRAFFEPHDVRIDRVAGQPNLELDGLPHIFDAKLAEPTYLFIRGDDRSPDKEHPLSAGIPGALGRGETVQVQPVNLPAESVRPALRSFVIEEFLTAARKDVESSQQAVTSANEAVQRASLLRDQLAAGQTPHQFKPLPAWLEDDFSKPRPEIWKTIRGDWVYAEGALRQTSLTPWSMVTTQLEHPRDFLAQVRLRTTGGSTKSVGLSFDVVGDTHFQSVYLAQSANTVQAFHRVNSVEAYPASGIFACPHKLNEELTVDVAVRDTLLNVWVNGQLKIVYRLPEARRNGAFALWNYAATSEFLDVRIAELPATLALAEKLDPAFPPLVQRVPTVAEAEMSLKRAEQEQLLTTKKHAVAQTELQSLEARVAAETFKYTRPAAATQPTEANQTEINRRSLAAAQAERSLAVMKAELAFLLAEQALATAKSASASDAAQKAVAEAEQKLSAARTALEQAQVAAQKTDMAYTPLGETYPETSTGRRLALANWIAHRQNPLTARVAVNHVWLRHFGKPLVGSVADFGLRSKRPTHPELLDWLSAEFMENGWSLKHLHRLIVTSNTYRLSSSTVSPSASADPENTGLWRMNSRRMEAEAVRDSVLALSGQLDRTLGGPSLLETAGQTSRRRSLYFRLSTEHKMEFLDLFDLASTNECYERRESVVPQQALALANSPLVVEQSRVAAQLVTRSVSKAVPQAQPLAKPADAITDAEFVRAAFEHVLTRPPTAAEQSRCEKFLLDQTALLKAGKLAPYLGIGSTAPASADPVQHARENLMLVLFNHNDFVTVR